MVSQKKFFNRSLGKEKSSHGSNSCDDFFVGLVKPGLRLLFLRKNG